MSRLGSSFSALKKLGGKALYRFAARRSLVMLYVGLSRLFLVAALAAKQVSLHVQHPPQLHGASAPLFRHPPFACVAPVSGGLVHRTPPQLESCRLLLYRDSEIFGGLLSRTLHSDRTLCVENDENDVTGGTPSIENALT